MMCPSGFHEEAFLYLVVQRNLLVKATMIGLHAWCNQKSLKVGVTA